MSPNQLGENFFSFFVVHVRWNNRIGYIILTEMSKKLELNDTIWSSYLIHYYLANNEYTSLKQYRGPWPSHLQLQTLLYMTYYVYIKGFIHRGIYIQWDKIKKRFKKYFDTWQFLQRFILGLPSHSLFAFCKKVSREFSTSRSVIPNSHERNGGKPHSLACKIVSHSEMYHTVNGASPPADRTGVSSVLFNRVVTTLVSACPA